MSIVLPYGRTMLKPIKRRRIWMGWGEAHVLCLGCHQISRSRNVDLKSGKVYPISNDAFFASAVDPGLAHSEETSEELGYFAVFHLDLPYRIFNNLKK